MKKIILSLSLLLCMSMITSSLVGCKMFDSLSKLESFTISDNDISKYKIIYASPDPESIKWENYYFGIDYQFDKMTANALKSKIQSIFGVELEVLCDTQTEPAEHEILIGKTNREETHLLGLDLLSQNDRRCQVANTKLVLCGGDYSSTYHCIDLIVNEFRAQADNGAKSVVLSTSFKSEKIYSATNIAIIGDGIFTKSMATDTDKLNVPSVLQRLLWKDYNVSSYLESESTVRADLNKGIPYTATESYKQLTQDCADLDAVIINLGTFDLYYSDSDWDKTDNAIFVSRYKSIVEELHSINSDLKFYICTTLKTGVSQDIVDAQTNVYNTLKDLEFDVTLIEIDKLMGEYVTDNSFIDEIYPNEFASAVIAKRIAAKLEKQ